jgi:UDP-N-acetylmuramate--alanine ligase
MPIPGEHNVQNALAAIAVAAELKIGDAAIRKALAAFRGVKRRFTRVGEWNGVAVIDDYGHHPVEIAAVLKAARAACRGRLIAVHQPHRFSRLHDLFEDFCGCFNDADLVAIADVYAAGEAPIAGVSRDALVGGLRGHGHRAVRALEGPEALAPLVAAEARPGDMVVCLGAGTITQWAHALPEELRRLA